MKRFILIWSFFYIWNSIANGQSIISSLYSEEWVIDNCVFQPKAYPILLSSIEAKVKKIDANPFIIVKDRSIFLDTIFCQQHIGDTMRISYRAFPIDFDKRFFIMDSTILTKKETVIFIEHDMGSGNVGGRPMINKGIEYDGSFSRGFSVGNSQSLVLNSNLNLQLNGDLGNGLKITAAITDDNIPIQAEGNTQVLQEFDKVFIEVSKDDTKVIAGDFELTRPNSYFMNYYKKLKGIGLSNKYQINDKSNVITQGNIASSRGKFGRQTLATKEGNQGPYRLVGNNNERFVIVLSGTEKIYTDGRLLKRGLEYDYIIDYNTAELTFSPSVLIKNESRIIVEFEYTDLNYFRTLYSFDTEIKSEKSQLYFHYYSEQDSKNSTSQIELGTLDLEILKNIGDSIAFRSGIIPYDSSSTQPGYKFIPNPDFPQDPNQNILIFTNDKNEVEANAIFTEVGTAKGSYIINSNAGVNARVYKYAGYQQGNYEPIITLIPPEQRQMMALGGATKINKYASINSELSLSKNDKNRFSKINDNDNVGIAGMAQLSYQKFISKDSIWKFQNNTGIEITNTNFNALNPYRNAEFTRDWNLPNTFIKKSSERIIYTNIGISHHKKGRIEYGLKGYEVSNDFKGWRHLLGFNYQHHGTKIHSSSSLTTTQNQLQSSTFIRPNIDISQAISLGKPMVVGVYFEAEDNKQQLLGEDSLTKASFAYQYIKSYIATDSAANLTYRLSYNKRKDQKSDGFRLQQAIDIDEAELDAAWANQKNQSININLKYRVFDVVEAELVNNEKSKKTLLGAVDHQVSLFKNMMSFGTNYLVNSGQEPKIEFVFTKVENNQGDYVYIGADTASVKGYNDFRYDPSNPLASYIRVSLPNNEFIRTQNISLNEVIRIEPKNLWIQDTIPFSKVKKLASRFGATASIRWNNKAMDDGGNGIRLFDFATTDTNLVSFNSAAIYNLYFNRGNPKFDMNIFRRNTNIKLNLINGIEERSLNEFEIRARYNIVSGFDFIGTTITGNKAYANELLSERNLDLDYYKINPSIEFRPSTKMRYAINYIYDQRDQRIMNLESAQLQTFTASINFRQASKSSLDVSTSLVNIKYNGEANGSIEYDILDGLKNGKNYLWNILFTKRISNSFDLNLNYEGRKTGQAPVVHVMRAEVKATF